MNSSAFLQDKKFLRLIDNLHIKLQYVRVTVLNWNLEPLELVSGKVISGSVNLDGSSSMRRTATLSLFAEKTGNNLANIDHLFSVNKKCILLLGIKNTVLNYTYSIEDPKTKHFIFKTIDYEKLYGDIVWFPLGLYVMFNPSLAHSGEGVTISMQLKDKMCLLNGDLGGQIHSSVDFGYQDLYVDINAVSTEKNQTLIYNIIKELVNHWGGEQLSKIRISLVPLQVKTVAKWDADQSAWLVETGDNNSQFFFTKDLAQDYINKNPDIDDDFPIKEIESGYDIGFKFTDFTYPGLLVCNAGDTVTSILDKIINTFGNYEYFYDVYGNFIFQLKPNYLNMTNCAYWQKLQGAATGYLPSDSYEADFYKLSKPVYNFVHNLYTSAFNNTLNYNNIKNNFVVWGAYKSVVDNAKYPCRFHLAIDKRPSLNIHLKIVYFVDDYGTTRAVSFRDAGDETWAEVVADVEKKLGWSTQSEITTKDWREEIYYQMLESEKYGTDENTEINNSYFLYYPLLKELFPKIYDLVNQVYKVDMLKHPLQIRYFLDFIDDNSLIGQYSVSNIGRRSIIILDSLNSNCVFEPVVPDIVYIPTIYEGNTEEKNKYIVLLRNRLIGMGQVYTQISDTQLKYLQIGGTLNSCYLKIKDLLYQYTHVNNTISITTLPIYYLEPNTRITVEDEPAGIYGDYIIQSISLPLDTSSTMSISAYKALQKI